MKNSDSTTIVLRYASLDFTVIPSFPNHLPKAEYFLRSGPKFSCDDLSLTLKHIKKFHDFTDLLKVKCEDVYMDKKEYVVDHVSVQGFWRME